MSEKQELQFAQNIVLLGGMQIIQASDELFNHVDAGLPMWSSDGDRMVRLNIAFRVTFADVPLINLGLTGVDSAHDQNLRFWLRAADVTPQGFSIEFSTWGDTHIARAAVSWQAVGEAYTKLPPSAVRGSRGNGELAP
ncbi:H-type lectin domain-containing protein [Paracoccus versutus]|uniref:H-type lectin domain-containing protein n=1 Tax=Paracoccus versutus TaxID=34007 RepID=UPI000B1791E2|nr:H-type lectin domain-containing protein [Paracoccus versutus]